MASRAHAIHYEFHPGAPRARREVWYRSDEDERISLPRQRSSGTSPTLAISALIASSVIALGAYAVYSGEPTPLAQTPTPALTPTWQPDPELFQASARGVLGAPLQAVPSVATTPGEPEETDPSSATSQTEPRETFIDDSAFESQPVLPQTPARPEAPSSAPYPNPTTTPPELVNPPGDPVPLPRLDPENPYRAE